jgi:hypothetical protein
MTSKSVENCSYVSAACKLFATLLKLKSFVSNRYAPNETLNTSHCFCFYALGR